MDAAAAEARRERAPYSPRGCLRTEERRGLRGRTCHRGGSRGGGRTPRAPASSSGPTAPWSLMPPPPPPAAQRRLPFRAPQRLPGPGSAGAAAGPAPAEPGVTSGWPGPGPGYGSRRRRKNAWPAARPAEEGGGGARSGCGAARARPRRRGDSVPRARPRSPGLAGRGGGSRDCGGAAPRAPSNEGAAAAARAPGLPRPQARTSLRTGRRKRAAQKGPGMSTSPYIARGALWSKSRESPLSVKTAVFHCYGSCSSDKLISTQTRKLSP